MHIKVAGQEPVRVLRQDFVMFRFAIANAFGVENIYYKRYIMAEPWTDAEADIWYETISIALDKFLFVPDAGGIISDKLCDELVRELSNIEIEAMGEYTALLYQFLQLCKAAAESENLLFWD